MYRNSICIGERKIGDGFPVYIVFEAGPTHDGIHTAKKLVDAAVTAGADAIKFQLLEAEKMVADSTVQFQYSRLIDKVTGETEEITESLLDILKRREMKDSEWIELITYCESKGIEFFSTATNEGELDFLWEHGINTIKICSGDVNYHYFLRQAAKYNWAVQIDTGSSSIGEIEKAVDILNDSGCKDYIINHCPSGYPARLEGINLRVLSTLRQMFPCPIAFSDHSPGMEMDISAVTLGANMIEKTITLDRTIRGPEHIMSLEPEESKKFVQSIRDMEKALGSPRRILSEEESMKRIPARRSLFCSSDINEGVTLTQAMLDYRRPGDGIPADLDTMVIGRKAKRSIPQNTKLRFEDFE